MNKRYIPNIITCLRLALIVPVAIALLFEYYEAALALFVVAGLSDALDGFLARRYGWISRFGSITDPLADKLLLVVCFFVLTWLEHIPLWLLIVVVSRDLIILSGALAYHYLYGPYEMEPTFLSKVNTLMQIFLVTLILLHLIFDVPPLAWINTIVLTVLITSLLSLAQYVWEWTLRALRARRAT